LLLKAVFSAREITLKVIETYKFMNAQNPFATAIVLFLQLWRLY